MLSSRTSAMKRTDWWAIGTEYQGCGRLFDTLFAYDQHRRSKMLRGTACCALPDENRINVTAAPRSNMSTAALQRRPAERTRGGGQKSTYFAYFAYFADYAYKSYCNNLRTGLPAAVRPVLRLHIFNIFNILHIKWGGVHIGHIFFHILHIRHI